MPPPPCCCQLLDAALAVVARGEQAGAELRVRLQADRARSAPGAGTRSSPPAASGAPWASVKTSSCRALAHAQVAAAAQVLRPLRRHPPPRAATRRPAAGRPPPSSPSAAPHRPQDRLLAHDERLQAELAAQLVRARPRPGPGRPPGRRGPPGSAVADPLARVVVHQVDAHPLGARQPAAPPRGRPPPSGTRSWGSTSTSAGAGRRGRRRSPTSTELHEVELDQRAVELGVDHAVDRLPHGVDADASCRDLLGQRALGLRARPGRRLLAELVGAQARPVLDGVDVVELAGVEPQDLLLGLDRQRDAGLGGGLLGQVEVDELLDRATSGARGRSRRRRAAGPRRARRAAPPSRRRSTWAAGG